MSKHLCILTLLFCASSMAGETQRFKVGASPMIVLENLSGDISVTVGEPGVVEIVSRSSDPNVKVTADQNGDRISVKTRNAWTKSAGGAGFRIKAPKGTSVKLATTSGDIDLDGIQGGAEVNAISGNIDATNVGGRLRLSTLSGDVDLDKVNSNDVEATSISGRVTMRNADLSKSGDYRLTTTSGSVSCSLAPNASVSARAHATAGRIIDNTGWFKVKKDEWGPGMSLRGAHNGGRCYLNLTTISGRVTINKD